MLNKNSEKKSSNKTGINSKSNINPNTEAVMLKPREIIPIMAQSSDPLGSYTGTPAGNPFEKPVQDADDL